MWTPSSTTRSSATTASTAESFAFNRSAPLPDRQRGILYGRLEPVRHGGAARAGIKPAPSKWPQARWFRRAGLAGCGHALRTRSKARRRGGLYGRPNRLPIFAAPSSNLVGRHAPMPPWPGRDDRGPGGCGGGAVRAAASRPYERTGGGARCLRASWFRRPGLAGCGHPALRTRSKARRRGGLYGRPNRLPIFAAPSSNLVGRHAHMPPWPGRDDRGPWLLWGCGPGGHIGRPYERTGGGAQQGRA